MATLSQRDIELIQEKARAGQQLSNPTPEKLAYYNQVQKVVEAQVWAKAQAGIPLSDPNSYTSKLYSNFTNGKSGGSGTIVNQQPNTPQYNPQAGSGAPNPVGSNPVMDTTLPVIIRDTNNQPMTPVGTGAGNPLNKLEFNAIAVVVVGFFFLRGGFKLLTKIF